MNLRQKFKKISKSTTHTVSNNQIFELPCPSLVLTVYGFVCAVCLCELQAAWHMTNLSNWCDRPAIIVVRLASDWKCSETYYLSRLLDWKTNLQHMEYLN